MFSFCASFSSRVKIYANNGYPTDVDIPLIKTNTADSYPLRRSPVLLLFWLVLVILLQGAMSQAHASEPTASASSFETILPKLVTDDFQEKEVVLEQLTKIDHPQLLNTFRYLLNGELYYRKSDKRVVHAVETGDGYTIYDVVTGQKLGVVGHFDVHRIGVDNKMRSMLGVEIAKLSLSSKDPKVRLEAVKEMISNLDPDSVKLLRARQKIEQNASVKERIDVALALANLNSGDSQQRLAAIDFLGDSLLPEVRIALKQLLFKNSDGTYMQKDAAIREAATRSLNRIGDKVDMYNFAQTTFFGLSLGSVLLLSAIGLAITFGVMGVINMAHGEMMMLGAYTTYLIQQMLPGMADYSLLISIPAAFVVSGLFGIAIERSVIRWLYGRPLETLLATFGISLILQQLVRTTISAQNVSVSTPDWMSGSWHINPVFALTYNRLYIVVFSLLVFVALLFILKKTVLGLQVRAVSQNRAMAKAMGVRSEWVDALTFGLGSGIAGIAGVALSQLTNVGPNLGQSYIIDSFMVVVFGGVGNLWGTLVGAMSLGVVNKFIEPWTGAVMAKILVLVFVILFIQKRPRGLFPQKGRAEEN